MLIHGKLVADVLSREGQINDHRFATVLFVRVRKGDNEVNDSNYNNNIGDDGNDDGDNELNDSNYNNNIGDDGNDDTDCTGVVDDSKLAVAQRAETTVAKCSLTNFLWACFRIGSHTMPGQRYSQPTPTSLGQGCMHV